jgi:hypothetical protein
MRTPKSHRMKTAKFRPFKTNRPSSPWRLTIPPHLSDTGKKRRLFFETQKEALVAAEQLKARKDRFGQSLSLLSSARIGEAAECFKLLDLHYGANSRPYSLLGIVRADIDLDRRRKASISFKRVFEQFLETREQKKRDEKYLKELRTALKRAEPIWEKLVCDITSEDLEAVLKPYSGRDAGMRYLRSVFNFARKRKLITENPISTMEFSEPKQTEVEIIPIADVEKLLLGALTEDLVLCRSNNYTYAHAAFFRRFFGFVHPGEISSSR